jgi:hypothetical protein
MRVQRGLKKLKGFLEKHHDEDNKKSNSSTG